MSADNYYEVKKHPWGGFTYVMGFDSYGGPTRAARGDDPQFADVWNAYKAASDDGWTEYGVVFHPECEQALRDYWGPATTLL